MKKENNLPVKNIFPCRIVTQLYPLTRISGEDIVQHFLDTLQNEIYKIFKKYITKPKPLILSDEDEMRFQNTTKCHICQRDFTENDIKVRDHCHILGHFRGAAHNSCNLLQNKSQKMENTSFLP